MAKTPASQAELKREAAGRYVTGDGRFVVEQASGGWMVSDGQQVNELGLPLVRGPFPTLGDARGAVAAVRAGPAPVSDLAARMATLPVRRGRGGERRPRGRSGSTREKPVERTAAPPVVTRAWRTGDGEGLRRLWAEVGMGSPGDDDASLARMAARNPGLLRVAAAGDRIVGSALGGWDGRRGWIYHVATAPDRRREGLARRLVSEVEERLRTLGCPKVNVIVLDAAPEAAAFWSALGYARPDARQYGKVLADGGGDGAR